MPMQKLDFTYLSDSIACSRACGHFFMGWKLVNGEPIKLNGAFYTNSVILKFVVASAAEAKLGALFHNCQDGIVSAKHWPISGILNLKRLFIAVMPQLLAFAIILSSVNNCVQWKCNIFGLVIRWLRKCTHWVGTPARRTLLTTKASTTYVCTIS